jgi:hypothetical protein
MTRLTNFTDGVRGPYRTNLDHTSPSASKSVSFIPLSPKSSKTMERHRKEHAVEDLPHSDEPDVGDFGVYDDNYPGAAPLDSNSRRSSDPTSHRPSIRESRRSRDMLSRGSARDDIEVLPDRFDSQGRPLDGQSVTQNGWVTRRGTFRREPQRPGGLDISGAWLVSGTDGQAVDGLVRNFTSALDGQRGGLLGVMGQLLGSGLVPGIEGRGPASGGGQQRHDHGGYDEDDGGRRRHGPRR